MAVVIETTLGDITVDLYLEQRPVTCLNFLKLCKMKYYNFNLFHTIRSGFIAQTGDPTGEGSGGESIFGLLEGPEKRFFSGEKMPKIRHTNTGLLSMVCTGDMMVGSQFFFTLGTDLDSLDGVHCVIGEVTEGHEVLRKLNEAICDETHRPYQDVRITHTVVLEDPFSDPPGLRAPSRSPSPCPERLKGGRIAPDEELDETQGKSAQEIQEIIEEKEAKARATILEIVGDLPDADIAPPENVLFVCKLNPVTTDEDLEIIFSRFGKIESCEVIRDKKTGDSLQYAFIEFADKKSCEDAYFKMDNVLIDDRRIHVDFSQSVSKMRWLGKGRGVQHFDDDEIKDNSFKQKATKPNNEQRSRDRKSNRDDDREKEKHKRHREEKNRDHEKNYERKNKGRENDRRDRSSSKEKYGDKYKRISKPDDVRREKMQRDRSKSIEKDNEVRKQKRDNDFEKRNRAEDARREKNYRDRSRSIERHNEKRQQNQEKEYDKQNKAESRKEKNGRERERNHLDDDERKHDTDVIYERKSRTSAVRKEVYSSTNRSGYDRNTEHEKEYERRSNVNDSRREKNFRERSNSVEINDKEIRQEYGRKIKADDGRRERSNSKERSKTSRQRSTAEVYRNREQKNSDYEHYDTGSKKNEQKESYKRNKSDSHKANNKSPSRNRDNSTDNDRASHRDRNDRIKEVESNEKSRERTEKDQFQNKGRKRQLEESKHTSNKKQKKSKREGGEPLTPSPTERKEKTKSKKSEKGKNNVKNEKNKKKKRKESTSSDSSTSESSSSSDSSSSSESDNKKKRLKRKRKYSSSSSSDSSDSSSSSSSSSDSSSDSSSSSSGSEKNKRRKKNVKRKVVKKIKKK